MEYEELLDRVYKNLPEEKTASERFEIPTAEIIVEGNKTIIKNFDSILSKLRRDAKMLSKYFFKELAVYGTVDGGRLVLNSKLNEKAINERIRTFTEAFVICSQCRRPDTKIVDIGHGLHMMICEACGARSSIPKI